MAPPLKRSPDLGNSFPVPRALMYNKSCWKLRHTQYSISHRMMVIGATDRLSFFEAYDVSV
jgi:hypothetical protein